MPSLDERLKDGLGRLARPADGSSALPEIARRRRRRISLRRVESVALVAVVLAGTAGGVALLNSAFGDHGQVTVPLGSAANGSIAYSATSGKTSRLVVVDPDSGSSHQLTNPGLGYRDSFPSWSPDGRTLAFVRLDPENFSAALYTVGADGDTLRKLTGPDLQPNWSAATWSPDGSRLAFVAQDDQGRVRLFVMNADGSGATSIAGAGMRGISSPSWSPDGTRIAFSGAVRLGDHRFRKYDIFTVSPTGSDLRNVSRSPRANETSVAWSPDGERLAYVQQAPGDLAGRVYVMDADGNGAAPVPTDDVLVASIAWAPNGRSMVFEGGRSTALHAGNASIFTVNVDGTDLARITGKGGSSPSWQPLAAPASSSP